MVVLCLNVVHMDGGILVTCLLQNQDIKLKYLFLKIAAKMSYVFSGSVCLLVGKEKANNYFRAPLPLSLSR